SYKIMATFSRGPREHWLKPHFSKIQVAKSGYSKSPASPFPVASAGATSPKKRMRFRHRRYGGMV
ncbi:MAG: hypothetical protein IJI35_09760, partial [Kiritimatiellae bacterium]|nr:hypothetical protein [Kiritimatiellia bacterium]